MEEKMSMLRLMLLAGALAVFAVESVRGGPLVSVGALLLSAPWLWFFCLRKQTVDMIAIMLSFAAAFLTARAFLPLGESLNQFFAFMANYSLFPYYVLRIGLIEELAKFLALFYVCRFLIAGIKHPADGIILASAVALGFATYENFFKLHELLQWDFAAASWHIFAGAMIRVPLHVLLAGIWGAAFGVMRFMPNRLSGRGLLVSALFCAVIAHAWWDLLALYTMHWLIVGEMVLLYAGLWLLYVRLWKATSPVG
jgi:RsiW-degrading membrane proteinase PrsW (M82 family)